MVFFVVRFPGVNMSQLAGVSPECTCVTSAGTHSMDSRVRRRTKSLGALRQGQPETDLEGHLGSQADSGTNSGATLRGLTASIQFLPYLFSNQSAAQAHLHQAGLNHQDRAALFASYPSVKCDIVEYL